MSGPPRPPRAVTFDFWNTLIRADYASGRERRLTAWLGLLAGEGFSFERDVVHDALKHAGDRFDESWKANEIYKADDAVRDMLEFLEIEPEPELAADLLRVISDPDPAHDPSPTPNVEVALKGLREAGVRVGIICDVGLAPSRTLRRFLERHELLQHFDHWSFSDEVGCCKPDPAIFEHARAGLGGFDPAEMAHIGDLRRTDVAGAQAAGWYAVRYTGVHEDPGSADDGSIDVEGDAVVADHADLLTALGID